jgi:hypothetical protein
MARTKKNTQLLLEMSSRLRHLVTDCLDASIEQSSLEMGYANSSVLRKAMSGQCFIDPEKLNYLSNIMNTDGTSANLHWLITGIGQPLLKRYSTATENNNTLLSKLDTLSPDKKAALATLLD